MTLDDRKGIGARMNDFQLDAKPGAEVREHGEIGPILVYRGHKFTTAKRAKRRGGQGK